MHLRETLTERLADVSLLQGGGWIGGLWRDAAADGRTFEVIDPATGDPVATLPDMGVAETRQAIDAAHAAQRAWAARTGKERAAILRRWHDLMLAHADDLAVIITAEMGKPMREARGEVEYGAAYVDWFAEEAKRTYGDLVPGHQRDRRLMVMKQPVGVVGAITPWNFPIAMVTRKLAPALAAGCAAVLKPAEQSPLSAIALCVLAERAGLPAGLINLIVSDQGPAVGAELCANPLVRKLSFTGSTAVGRILMRQGADQIKKLSLELGGHAPFIVFDDADIDQAVDGAILSKFRNAGQTCVCANRIYVQSGVYDRFAERLCARVAALRAGNGFDAASDIGPLIDADSAAKVAAQLSDAEALGARVLTGGAVLPGRGNFFAPTVIADTTMAMRIAREETFGPVAPLFRFDTIDEVVEQANQSDYGLAAYFYTADISRAWQVAEALEYGIVGINTGIVSTEVAPAGGWKQSGLGREGSRYGIEDYLELKYVCLALDAA